MHFTLKSIWNFRMRHTMILSFGMLGNLHCFALFLLKFFLESVFMVHWGPLRSSNTFYNLSWFSFWCLIALVHHLASLWIKRCILTNVVSLVGYCCLTTTKSLMDSVSLFLSLCVCCVTCGIKRWYLIQPLIPWTSDCNNIVVHYTLNLLSVLKKWLDNLYIMWSSVEFGLPKGH